MSTISAVSTTLQTISSTLTSSTEEPTGELPLKLTKSTKTTASPTPTTTELLSEKPLKLTSTTPSPVGEKPLKINTRKQAKNLA
jgi:hypothetical protein